jgi:hypothetical protein
VYKNGLTSDNILFLTSVLQKIGFHYFKIFSNIPVSVVDIISVSSMQNVTKS